MCLFVRCSSVNMAEEEEIDLSHIKGKKEFPSDLLQWDYRSENWNRDPLSGLYIGQNVIGSLALDQTWAKYSAQILGTVLRGMPRGSPTVELFRQQLEILMDDDSEHDDRVRALVNPRPGQMVTDRSFRGGRVRGRR